MSRLSTISRIELREESSWNNKIFLTFDIDWAHDDVLNNVIDIVEESNVSATWFVTHKTKVLERLKRNPSFELGIHPNFNFLLEGNHCAGSNAKDVVQRCLDIVPGATAVRSHSMAQSSVVLNIFKECGLTHDVNHFIPHHANFNLKPWVLWDGLLRVPYIWEDDLHIQYESIGITQKNPLDIISTSDNRGIVIFDFHPIHVYLNTESLDRYEQTRSLHQKPAQLIKHRYEGYGTYNRLVELLEACKES